MKKTLFLLVSLFINVLVFSQCLNGVYTIGGTSPSYTSITQAVTSLTVNGVCGPVTFNIRPGTYNEKVSIPAVAGTSSVNTITIQSENGDSTSVVMQAAGTFAANYVMEIKGTTYVTLKKMTFKNTHTGYSACVVLMSGATNFKLANCVLDAPVNNTISTYRYNLLSKVNLNILVQNNKFNGGQRGVSITTSSGSVLGVNVSNNIFTNQYEQSISLGSNYCPVVSGNTIISTSNHTSYRAIYVAVCTGSVVIEKNKVEHIEGSGIVLFVNHNFGSPNSRISNNVIKSSGSTTNWGMDLQECYNLDVLHNTVVSTTTHSASTCVAFNDMQNLNIKNNIFHHKGNGLIYSNQYILTTGLSIDYNDVKNAGGTFANIINSSPVQTFGSWRNLGYDLHSINQTPQFVSTTDFHPAADFSQNLIIPYFASVPDDVEGNLRDNTSPYFGAYEIVNPQNANDAAIDKFMFGAAVCPGNQPLNVLLRNFGINPLTSATLNWSLNGTTQTPVNWTGNLGFYDSLSVTLGNMNFVDLSSNDLKVWTSAPNGASDAFAINDTIATGIMQTALSGTYTIGGSAPTFTSINAAVSNLISRGVCGNVIFNIRNGMYNENLVLPAIKGLYGTNKVIFQSEIGVASNVIIASTTTLNTVAFAGINNVIFKNVTLGTGGIMTSIVAANSGSDNVEINSCVFNGAYSFKGIEGTLSNKTFTDLSILNNTFNNCSHAIYLIGYSGGSNQYYYNRLKINNNTASGINNCIMVSNIDTMELNGNNVAITNVSITSSYAILSAIHNLKAFRNKFVVKDAIGINIGNTLSGTIANNFFVSTGTLSTYAITLSNQSTLLFINNAVNSINTHTQSAAMLCSGNGYYDNFYNNCIQNEGPGVALEESVGAFTPLRFRNNVYYSNGTNLIKFNSLYFQDFATWQTILQTDTNSLNIKPLYTSSTDLHVNEIFLKGAGKTVAGNLTDDFDGQPRNTTAPDIGADEFTPLTLDAGTNGFGFGSMVCSGFNPVEVRLKNNGTTNLTSATLNCKVNTTSLPAFNWTGNLASGAEILVNVGSYNFILGTGYTVKAWSTLPNGTPDTFRANDTTLKVSSSTGMNGVFTIGGSSPSYSTIASAVSALKTNGVCGPIVFNIRDGVYTEQVKIPYIKGCSSMNTILFQSESLDSSLVSIEYNNSASFDYIINTDSTDYITFYKLGFKPLNTTYANVLTFTNRTSHVTVKNCSFNGQNTTGQILVMNSLCDSALISYNRFYKGNIAVFINGAGNKILNNYFEDQSLFGINGVGVQFDYSSNTLNFPTAVGRAIYISGASGGKLSKNKIQYSLTSNAAISITGGGTFQNQFYITNNFISLNGGVGLALNGLQFLNLINNSINQFGSGSCLSYTNMSTTTSRNNIYSNASGYCVRTSGTNTSFNTNYNCFYSPSNQLINVAGTLYSSLSAFNTVTSMEGNSVYADPQFISNTDLHTSCLALNGAGQYNFNVPDDIDGDIRYIPVFDIGADEYSIPYSRVFPGDANSDLMVTSQDLYTLGLHYGNVGHPRDSISNLFIGHNSLDWNVTQLNTPYDVKFADCNGDSLINMNDTLAIHLNYNLYHAPKPLAVVTNTLMDIFLTYNKAAYSAGDTVKADIMVGSSSNVMNNMYGMAFMLNYDQSLVKANSEKMIYINSWLGNINSTKIKFAKIIPGSGLLDASLVRIMHTDVNGFGKIGTFEFVLKDTISSGYLNLNISNGNRIDHNGVSLPLTSGVDSVLLVSSIVTSVADKSLNEVKIFPNPAGEFTTIHCNEVGKYKIEVLNVRDQLIFSDKIISDNYKLNTSEMAKGVYAVRIIKEDGTTNVMKLIVQ